MRVKPVRTRADRRRRIRIFLAVVILTTSFLLPWLAARWGWLGIDSESAINVFACCFTAVGTIMVVFELNDSEKVSCCSMLSDMNMKFIENPRMMRLYQELCYCVQRPGWTLVVDDHDPDAVHSSDLMAYMTFYEVMNEYIKNGIMSIQQMDDLFGDRFFKLIHNDYVQEHELYAEPSSYVNIFQLYDTWLRYRHQLAHRSKSRFVVSSDNAIPELYLTKKLYLQETIQFFMNEDGIPFTNSHGVTKHLSLRRLLPKHLQAVDDLQKTILALLPDKSIFAPSTKNEILESMLVDFCYGLFDGEKLVAVCICVLNRPTVRYSGHERNLCVMTDTPNAYSKYITFDTIQVDPAYRGFGIQRFFLQRAERVAKAVHASKIAATVSPNNRYSHAMFQEAGYEVFGGKEISMYDSVRYLMVKNI